MNMNEDKEGQRYTMTVTVSFSTSVFKSSPLPESPDVWLEGQVSAGGTVALHGAGAGSSWYP